MARLFLGIALPEPVADHLALVGGGVPGARWELAEKLHLTLRFLDEIDGGTQRAIEQALARVDMPAFELVIAGVGHFPPRGKPRSIWAGLEDDTQVVRLHDKIERALSGLGLAPDARKFAPHITLARLRDAPDRKVAEFLANHALMKIGPFAVEEFRLYSSVRSPGGSKYRTEAAFALQLS